MNPITSMIIPTAFVLVLTAKVMGMISMYIKNTKNERAMNEFVGTRCSSNS